MVSRGLKRTRSHQQNMSTAMMSAGRPRSVMFGTISFAGISISRQSMKHSRTAASIRV